MLYNVYALEHFKKMKNRYWLYEWIECACKSGYMNYVLVILNLMLIVKNSCVHSVVFEYKCFVDLRYSWTILISIIPAEKKKKIIIIYSLKHAE